MPKILKYIDIYIENNSSYLNDTIQKFIPIKYNYSKTIFIQVILTRYIIVSASMAK